MSDGKVEFSAQGKKKTNAEMKVIPLSNILVVEGFNPRFDTGDVETLRASIAKVGLDNPLTVRPTDKKDKYQLIAGHRRMKALQELGREDAPCIIRTDLDDEEKAKAYAIAENSEDGRTNLTYVEMGSAFVQLQKDEQWGPARIATETGVHQHTVKRALKVMELEQEVLDLIQAGSISPTAALAYAKLTPDLQALVEITELEDPSAHLIKRLATEAKKKLKASEKADDGDADSTKKTKGKVGVSWRTPTERKAAIEELAHTAYNPKNPGAKEATEMLKVLYWVRGHGEKLGDLSATQLKSYIKEDNERYMKKMKADAKKAEKEPQAKGKSKAKSKAKGKGKKKG